MKGLGFLTGVAFPHNFLDWDKAPVRTILLCAALFAVVCPAFADFTTTRIKPVAAYASSSASKTSPSGVIRNEDLSDSGGHSSSNGSSSNTQVWYSNGAPSGFVMDLGAAYSVSALKFWNYNGSSHTNRGLKNIDVLFSVETDAYSSGVDFDNGKWTVVKSIDELGKAPGSDGWTGNDPITLTAPQSARFIGIRINSTWGATEGGLSEFRADVVDEVYSVELDGLSFAAPSSATLSGTMTSSDSSSVSMTSFSRSSASCSGS